MKQDTTEKGERDAIGSDGANSVFSFAMESSVSHEPIKAQPGEGSVEPLSPGAKDNSNSTGDFANKFRRLKACARCHRLKMRCVFEDPTYSSCRRCYAAGIMCSMTSDPTLASARSRPRKRTRTASDKPVSQLQNAITDAFNILSSFQRGMDQKPRLETPHTNERDQDSEDESPAPDQMFKVQSQLSELQHMLSHVISQSRGGHSQWASSMNSMKEGPIKSVPKLPFIPYEYNICKELFKLEILTHDDAALRFETFCSEMLCYWPCVSLPDAYTFDFLLENEPLVLLGFISVTCLNEPDLHDTLLYYLDRNLAQRVSITGDITASLIQVYIVLSLWCSPPRKWGSYKHQMNLLTALNLSLCLDLGNEHIRTNSNVLQSNAEERKMVRAFVGVYSCCGSLGLSLPRFKVVTWTPHHDNCCRVLLMGESNRNDMFLCYYARLIGIGQEIFDFLCPDGVSPSHENFGKREESVPPGSVDDSWQSNALPHESLRAIMISYEKRMQQCASESGLLAHDSKERNLLSIIYYQLLMTMYDYVVCRVLSKQDVLTEVYMQTLSRLIRAGEKVIDSFVNLCEQTPNFPTFFYYRPMHALVALIRSRLLVRSQRLDLEINVEREYERVSTALAEISKKSLVAKKMSAILTRVEKWMKVSNKFTKDGANNSMVTLLDELGKEKAIETLKAPKKVMVKIERDAELAGSDSRVPTKNRFINYDVQTIADRTAYGSKSTPSPVVATPTRKRSVSTRAMNAAGIDSESSSGQKFVPSPIGFSRGEESPSDNSHPAPIGESVGNNPTMEQDVHKDSATGLAEDIGFAAGLDNIGVDQDVDFDFNRALGDIFSQIDADVINYFPEASPSNSTSEEYYGLDEEAANSRRFSVNRKQSFGTMFHDMDGYGFW
ncbi:unnamed protein product [Kuraishia capsulata CBS 1993]|uniref:Zn(2)-C6 fungal-type domain-containing protein n=1 Tax=Kuraishia capsulata CBS 1993 TaxID=1382522 RepID=W6MRI2_9ASCO|nr:uncharacterized protein KUCA_T00005349001 [Kuraishia capsulata CBS 1993]CDK29361.1 unnamed protein product [Kuraishia capsulata CBS 1993]